MSYFCKFWKQIENGDASKTKKGDMRLIIRHKTG
jgi:hypothetical protein